MGVVDKYREVGPRIHEFDGVHDAQLGLFLEAIPILAAVAANRPKEPQECCTANNVVKNQPRAQRHYQCQRYPMTALRFQRFAESETETQRIWRLVLLDGQWDLEITYMQAR